MATDRVEMQDVTVVKLRYSRYPETTWLEAKVYEASDTSPIYRARGFVRRIDLTPEELQLGIRSRCAFESIRGATTSEKQYFYLTRGNQVY